MKRFKIKLINCAEDDIVPADFPNRSDAVVSTSRVGTRINHLQCGVVRSTALQPRKAPANFDLEEGGIALVAGEYLAKVGGCWVGCHAYWTITLDGRALEGNHDGVPYPILLAEQRAQTSIDGRGCYSVWQTGPSSFETRTSTGSSMGSFETPERADDLASRMAKAYDARSLRGPGFGPEPTRTPLSLGKAESEALAKMLAKRALCDRFLSFAEESRSKTISVGRAVASGTIDGEPVEVELPFDVLQAALDDGSLERVAREWLAAIDVAVEATYGVAVTSAEA